MKILTLNTHSLIEENYESKLHIFTNTVLSEKPDVITLQEVNQSITAKFPEVPERFQNAGNIPIKADNHALKVYELLRDGGLDYHFCWIGIKKGYEKYDEGLATFSLQPFRAVSSVTLSQTDNYSLWKTRKCLITRFKEFTVCNTHLGWWDDTEEPFINQWKKLGKALDNNKSLTLLAGDFNSPSHIKGEGYDLITSSGWYDSYCLAKQKDEGFTVSGIPDGWNKKIKTRIDYIFTNQKIKVQSSATIFKEHPVSDHYGVMIETR